MLGKPCLSYNTTCHFNFDNQLFIPGMSRCLAGNCVRTCRRCFSISLVGIFSTWKIHGFETLETETW